jgi:hypothetical protein
MGLFGEMTRSWLPVRRGVVVVGCSGLRVGVSRRFLGLGVFFFPLVFQSRAYGSDSTSGTACLRHLHATTRPTTTARLRSRVTRESVEEGRVQRFQVGGDDCETSVAETVGRRRTSRPTSLTFYFRSESFNPAGKRGTLALVTRRPLQLLESRVSRLLLVILWVRGLGLSLADGGWT